MPTQNLFIALQFFVIAGGLIYPPLHLAAESRAKDGLAAEWMEQGGDAYRRGHFEEAVTYLDKAAHGYEQEGAQLDQSQALAKKAEAYLALGRSEQEITELRLALQFAETTKAPSERAPLLGRLGAAYFQAGRIEEARRQLEASVESARALKNPRVTATSLNNLGTLFASQKHYEQALKHYLEGAKLAEQASDHTMAAKALTNAARISLSKSNGHRPESLLVSAHEHIKRADDSHDKAFVLMSLGQLYQRLQGSDPHPSQRAYDALTSALSIAEAIDDKRVLSYAVGYLGMLYEEQSRFDEALRLTRRAEFVELLTLSACQTAAGDDRAALGLAGVAIKAGARSALASLWFINDRASALLVSEFYRRLQDPTLSKARALQQAQLTLIGDKRYRHPGYWAPGVSKSWGRGGSGA